MLVEKQIEFLRMLPDRRARDVHALHYLYAPGYGYHCLDVNLRDPDVNALNAKVVEYFASLPTREEVVANPAPERFWRLMAAKSGPDSTSIKLVHHIFTLRLKNTKTKRTGVSQINLTEREAKEYYA